MFADAVESQTVGSYDRWIGGMTSTSKRNWTLNLFCITIASIVSRRSDTEHSLVGHISPEQYLDFFNSTGKNLLFHLTGGEPFFHPDFVLLCQR